MLDLDFPWYHVPDQTEVTGTVYAAYLNFDFEQPVLSLENLYLSEEDKVLIFLKPECNCSCNTVIVISNDIEIEKLDNIANFKFTNPQSNLMIIYSAVNFLVNEYTASDLKLFIEQTGEVVQNDE